MNKIELIESTKDIEIYRLETEPFGTNTYIVCFCNSHKAILVDAPGSADLIRKKFNDRKFQFILMTHGHGDHTMALEELHEILNAPLAVHKGDVSMLPLKADQLLEDGDLFNYGSAEVEVIHVPGHTPGSLCFKIGKYLISGDTLFPGGPGKTGSAKDFKIIMKSIKEKLLTLPDETVVLPGHGTQTTIGKERKQIESFIEKGYPDDLHGDVTWA